MRALVGMRVSPRSCISIISENKDILQDLMYHRGTDCCQINSFTLEVMEKLVPTKQSQHNFYSPAFLKFSISGDDAEHFPLYFSFSPSLPSCLLPRFFLLFSLQMGGREQQLAMVRPIIYIIMISHLTT